MNFFKTVYFFALSVLLLGGSAFAVPAYPGIIESKQPDGSVVRVRMVGNEHFHYTVSEDSELVVRDSLGYWNYADEQGKPTGMRFHHRDKRGDKERKFNEKRDSKKILQEFLKKGKMHRGRNTVQGDSLSATSFLAAPLRAAPLRAAVVTPTNDVLNMAARPKFTQSLTQGEIRGLIILVQFSDVKFKSSDPQADYARYMNEEGYHENGMKWSIRDYFVANSMGAFRPHFDVAAPVTLSNTRGYYGTLQISYDGGNSYMDYPDSALAEALKIIKQRGDIDFTLYDNDGDRYVDFVYMIYAGVGEADSGVEESIWPQAGATNPVGVAGTCKNMWDRNCYYVSRFACSNEISGPAYRNNPNTKILAGMGTFVHEYSHVLGLPDLYNTTNMDDAATPSIWSLMDMGEYNVYPENTDLMGVAPPRLSAFERYSLGWMTPRVLEKENGEITLYGIDQNDGILIPSSNKNEYFLLDYRAKYDTIAPLPSSGLLVWSVGYNADAWDNNQVNVDGAYRMKLIRADKKAGQEIVTSGWYSYYAPMFEDDNLKGDPFPGRKKVVEFDEFVTFAGKNLGLRIYDITEGDSAVTFKVKWDGVEGWPSSSSVAESSSSSSLPESSSSSAIALNSSSDAVVSSSSALPLGVSSSEGVTGIVAGAFVPQVHMTLEGRTLHVVAGFEGEKEIRVFDMQGHQLYAGRFAGNSTVLQLGDSAREAHVVRLTAGNRVLAVKRL